MPKVEAVRDETEYAERAPSKHMRRDHRSIYGRDEHERDDQREDGEAAASHHGIRTVRREEDEQQERGNSQRSDLLPPF